jgi:hypothetical protein
VTGNQPVQQRDDATTHWNTEDPTGGKMCVDIPLHVRAPAPRSGAAGGRAAHHPPPDIPLHTAVRVAPLSFSSGSPP